MYKLMQEARAKLLVRHAFFATLMMHLELFESEETETMATDGKAIYFNPTWVSTLAMIEIMSVMAHEVLHVIFCHHLRRNGRDAQLWNEACDYAINWILVESDVFQLPEGGLYDPKYKGMTAETIYNLLANNQDQDQDQSTPDNAPGDSEQAQSQPLIGEVWDATNDQGEPLNEAEKATAELDAKAMAKQAMATDKNVGVGDVDSELKKIIAADKVNDIPWYEILQDYVRDFIEDATSFMTPDLRMLSAGFAIPGPMEAPNFKLVIAWDTSGSLTNELTGIIQAHVNNMVTALNPSEVFVRYIDTKVRGGCYYSRPPGSVGSITEVELNPVGGGGTRFDPLFEHLEEEDIEPDCVIYFTDGIGQVNIEEPDYPVIWATTDRKPGFKHDEFGIVVDVE